MPGTRTIKSYITQNFRRENRDGKTFLVVPGTPMQEQVMNNYLVPADEINHFVEAWNGSPITLRHPKQNNGSANVPNPDVPIVGRFYNAAFDGKRMTGEYWFDEQALQAQDPMTLNKIVAGQSVETSTGYWADEEDQTGTFNNVSYDLIHRNLRPDHIAVLPDEIGACSIANGCGVNRNQSMTPPACPMGDQCPMMKGKGVSMNDNIQKFINLLSGKGIKVKVNEEAGKEPTFELEETPAAPVAAPVAHPAATPAQFSDGEIAALKALAASAPVLQNAAQVVMNESKTRRTELVASIKTNSANPFGDAELDAMPESALMKLNAHLNTNFMAISGVQQNANEDQLIAIAPDTFAWAQGGR